MFLLCWLFLIGMHNEKTWFLRIFKKVFFFFLINHLFTYLNITIVANNNQIDYLINCITTSNNNVKRIIIMIIII